MIERQKPKLNQEIYVLNVGNNERYTKQELKRTVVNKVGHKYFYIDHTYLGVKFNISDWYEHSNFSSNYKLYETEQEYLDEKESESICRLISDIFTYGRCKNNLKITVEDLRKIKKIIEGVKNEY